MTTKDYCSINFTGLTHDHTLECRGELGPSSSSSPAAKEGGEENGQEPNAAYCSAIPILKQHPMYDCLVLVRKYRNCLAGYSLEFPVDKIREHERLPTNESAAHQHLALMTANDNLDQQSSSPAVVALEDSQEATAAVAALGGRSACSQRRLVSRFLDGDDPVYRATIGVGSSLTSSMSQTSMTGVGGEQVAATNLGDLATATPSTLTTTTTQPGTGGSQTDETDARLLFMTQVDDRGDQCHLVHVPINGLLDRLESYTRNGIAVDSRVYAFAMGLKTAERMMTTKSMKELHETPI